MNGHPFLPRLLMLFEIFYGLAIASGLEQVAPLIFAYGSGPLDLAPWSCPWFFLVVASSLALAIGVANCIWFAIHQHKALVPPWTNIFFLFYPILIFALFASAYSPVLFFSVVFIFTVFSLVRAIVVKCIDTDASTESKGQGIPFLSVRAACALLVLIGVCILRYWLKPESPWPLRVVGGVGLLIVAGFTAYNVVIIWIELRPLLYGSGVPLPGATGNGDALSGGIGAGKSRGQPPGT